VVRWWCWCSQKGVFFPAGGWLLLEPPFKGEIRELGAGKQGSDKMRTEIETAILHCDVVAINKTEKWKHTRKTIINCVIICDMEAVRLFISRLGFNRPDRRGICNANPNS